MVKEFKNNFIGLFFLASVSHALAIDSGLSLGSRDAGEVKKSLAECSAQLIFVTSQINVGIIVFPDKQEALKAFGDDGRKYLNLSNKIPGGDSMVISENFFNKLKLKNKELKNVQQQMDLGLNGAKKCFDYVESKAVVGLLRRY